MIFLRNIFFDIDIDINSPQDNYFRINGFEKYNKETYEEFYKKITPFVSYGTIKFSGEGGDCWKHSFKNGVWEEYSGKIVYDKKPSTFYDSNKDNKEDDLDL